MKVVSTPPAPPKPDVKIVLSQREAAELYTFLIRCTGYDDNPPDYEAWVVTDELAKALDNLGIREIGGLGHG